MKFNFKRASEIKPLLVETKNKGYIPLVSAGYNILAGEGGVGKSLVAIKSMIVYLNDHVNKQAIMFMTEDGINECTNRTKNICANMGLDYNLFENRIYWITLEEISTPKLAFQGFGGVKEKDTEAIGDLCNFSVTNNVGFICFDPLRAFHELDENSNQDMPFLTRDIFPQIGKMTGAVVLVLHHSAKGEGSAVRGAGSIGNDARMAWIVSKAVDKNKLTGKREVKEGYENKIHLSVYKDNFNTARYCKIRDKEGMIFLPTQRMVNENVPVQVEEYNMDMPYV